MSMYGVHPAMIITEEMRQWGNKCTIKFGSIVLVENMLEILAELNMRIQSLNLEYRLRYVNNMYEIDVSSRSIDSYVKRGEILSRAIGILE